MNIKTFNDFKEFEKNNNVENVILRCDLNLPSETEDLSRIFSISETVHELLRLGKKVILLSHYKRPKKEDYFLDKFSLKKITDKVSYVLGVNVDFKGEDFRNLTKCDIKCNVTLLENIRFYEGEEKNSEELAEKLSKLADAYINEAFSVSHRSHMSVCALTKYLPSFAGISLENEIKNIEKVTGGIKRPFVAIIGGSKVSSKIDVLRNISKISDYLIITGAMANTFLKAIGHNMGKSLIEEDKISDAKEIYENSKAKIILPVDFLVSEDIHTDGRNVSLDKIGLNDACFDIGEKTVLNAIDVIKNCKTLLWNGALGAFEFSNFNKSSELLSEYIANQTKSGKLISIIGGGETIASVKELKKDMTFVSTAGGAFLEFIAGYELPGISCLNISDNETTF